jgi:hypothetical protein
MRAIRTAFAIGKPAAAPSTSAALSLSWLLISAVAIMCAPASAAPCQRKDACDPSCERACVGVAMPSALIEDGKKLCLNGLGLREATILNVDVYVAGLYLERRGNQGQQLANSEQLKRMQLHFVRDVSRDEIAEAIGSSFEHSAAAGYAAMKPRIDRFTKALPQLKQGDTLSFTYRPGRGTSVSYRAKRLIEIPGGDFASALFRIWLGNKPPNEGLRRGLLGGKCG